MIANCQNLHPTFRKMINGRPKKIINLQDWISCVFMNLLFSIDAFTTILDCL